jgi:hypothetical protein
VKEHFELKLAILKAKDGTLFVAATASDDQAHLYPYVEGGTELDTTETSTICGRFLSIKGDHLDSETDCETCARRLTAVIN